MGGKAVLATVSSMVTGFNLSWFSVALRLGDVSCGCAAPFLLAYFGKKIVPAGAFQSYIKIPASKNYFSIMECFDINDRKTFSFGRGADLDRAFQYEWDVPASVESYNMNGMFLP